jgi:UDP-N-acetylmuramate dehydrogenase
LARELEAMGVTEVSPRAVSRAVCRIRKRKLPDPAVLGNAGSFFQNPVVPEEAFRRLKARHEGIVAFPDAHGRVKLAAGWLIDRLGWKGFRRGPVGVHAEHALVLVNYGGASASQLLRLADEIRLSVRQAFGIDLEIEPRVY